MFCELPPGEKALKDKLCLRLRRFKIVIDIVYIICYLRYVVEIDHKKLLYKRKEWKDMNVKKILEAYQEFSCNYYMNEQETIELDDATISVMEYIAERERKEVDRYGR